MSKQKDEFILRKNCGTAFTFTAKDGGRYIRGDFNHDGKLHTVFGKVSKCKNGELHIFWSTTDAVEAEIAEGQRRAEYQRDRATKIEQ